MKPRILSGSIGLATMLSGWPPLVGGVPASQIVEGPDQIGQRGLAALKAHRFSEARGQLARAVSFDDAFGEDGWPRYAPKDAAYQLGVLFRDGLGGPKDPRAAGCCFVLALGEEAPLDAYLDLARLYRTGAGVPEDRAFAGQVEQELLMRARNSVWWHSRKADAARAARMFIQGEVFPRDLIAAADLYYVMEERAASRNLLEQASNEGNAEAHWRLASSFLGLGWPVTERDPNQAITHLQAAGRLGKAQAWFDLGMLYHQGEAAPKNEARAFECFLKAGDLGAYFLGMAYWEGRIAPRDVVKARHFLLIASKQDRYTRGGLPALAEIYRSGLGVSKDPVLAARYSPLKAFKQVPPPAAPKVPRPWEGEADRVVDIHSLLSQEAPADSWLEYGIALQSVTRMASAATAFRRARDLGSVKAEWLLGRLLMGDWGLSGDDMAAVAEPMNLEPRKGEALIVTAKQKGVAILSGAHAEQDQEQWHRARASQFPDGDPRRLFHQVRAWEYSPKD